MTAVQASTQPRKFVPARRNGRFCKVGRHRKKPRGRGAGVYGSSYLRKMSKLGLSRMLVGLEDKLASLQVEIHRGRGRAKGNVSVFQPRGKLEARMKGIRAQQEASIEAKVTALEQVLIELAEKRVDQCSAAKLAELMALKTGTPVSSRQLYRMPYVTMWRPELDYLGSEPIDKDPRVRRYIRRTKGRLIGMILQTRENFRSLSAGREARLLEGTEDWQLL